MRTELATLGWAGFLPDLDPADLDGLRDGLFSPDTAGTRCLLDHPLVQRTALRIAAELVALEILGPTACAIQAITFDKSPAANWKVPWHQDLMFPLAAPATHPSYATPSLKDGIPYARPPVGVLRELLAARLHLDDCPLENGPLRLASGTHQEIIPSDRIAKRVRDSDNGPFLASAGEVLLMRPLTLHASSKAVSPARRRVLHLVFHDGPPPPSPWHRAITLGCFFP